MPITINTSRAPVFLVTFPAEFSLDELRMHFDRMEGPAQRSKIVTIIDVSAVDISRISVEHRRVAAECYRKFSANIPAGHLVGEAFLLSSPIARGLLTAVRWLAPPSWPNKNFSRERDALAWAGGLLASAQDAAPRAPVRT